LKPYRLDLTPAFGRHNRVARDQLDSAERWVINVMADFNHGDHGNTAGARRAGNGGRQIARSENDHPSATIQVPVRLEQIQRTHAAQHTAESPARESQVQVRRSCREDQLVSVNLPGARAVEDAKSAVAKAAPDQVPCQHLNTDVYSPLEGWPRRQPSIRDIRCDASTSAAAAVPVRHIAVPVGWIGWILVDQDSWCARLSRRHGRGNSGWPATHHDEFGAAHHLLH